MTPKVVGILRHRYADCNAASNIFRRLLPKIVLYGYVMLATSKVMYSVHRFLGVPTDTGCVMAPISSIVFPPKP
jgi:hypothetical protein